MSGGRPVPTDIEHPDHSLLVILNTVRDAAKKVVDTNGMITLAYVNDNPSGVDVLTAEFRAELARRLTLPEEGRR